MTSELNRLPYEIYNTARGRRVNIEGQSYPLEIFSGKNTSFDVGDKYDGTPEGCREPLLRAWLFAAREVGVPFRYAWHGVMNSMGHTGDHKIPWKANVADFGRDDRAPILPRDWKVWVEWAEGRWAEYALKVSEKWGSFAAWNENELCFNGYETYGYFRIATNALAVAQNRLGGYLAEWGQEFVVVSSFDELGGELMPCPIYLKGRSPSSQDTAFGRARVAKLAAESTRIEEEAARLKRIEGRRFAIEQAARLTSLGYSEQEAWDIIRAGGPGAVEKAIEMAHIWVAEWPSDAGIELVKTLQTCHDYGRKSGECRNDVPVEVHELLKAAGLTVPVVEKYGYIFAVLRAAIVMLEIGLPVPRPVDAV